MKIVCIYNRESIDLPLEAISKNEPEKMIRLGIDRNLKIGSEYLVVGIALDSQGNLDYIVHNDRFLELHSSALFEISNNSMKADWFFRPKPPNGMKTKCVWGYKELCEDDDHLYSVLDGDARAREIAKKRKKEFEEAERIFSKEDIPKLNQIHFLVLGFIEKRIGDMSFYEECTALFSSLKDPYPWKPRFFEDLSTVKSVLELPNFDRKDQKYLSVLEDSLRDILDVLKQEFEFNKIS